MDEQCFFGVNSTSRYYNRKKSMIGVVNLSNVDENSVFKGIETQPRKLKSNKLKKDLNEMENLGKFLIH